MKEFVPPDYDPQKWSGAPGTTDSVPGQRKAIAADAEVTAVKDQLVAARDRLQFLSDPVNYARLVCAVHKAGTGVGDGGLLCSPSKTPEDDCRFATNQSTPSTMMTPAALVDLVKNQKNLPDRVSVPSPLAFGTWLKHFAADGDEGNEGHIATVAAAQNVLHFGAMGSFLTCPEYTNEPLKTPDDGEIARFLADGLKMSATPYLRKLTCAPAPRRGGNGDQRSAGSTGPRTSGAGSSAAPEAPGSVVFRTSGGVELEVDLTKIQHSGARTLLATVLAGDLKKVTLGETETLWNSGQYPVRTALERVNTTVQDEDLTLYEELSALTDEYWAKTTAEDKLGWWKELEDTISSCVKGATVDFGGLRSCGRGANALRLCIMSVLIQLACRGGCDGIELKERLGKRKTRIKPFGPEPRLLDLIAELAHGVELNPSAV
jgi:hypothetical protein